MKILLIAIIKLYWAAFPESKRRKCIFRISCSQYVYQATKNEGLYKGLVALRCRYLNCRTGFHIFENPNDGTKIMILPNGQTFTEDEIAERFVDKTKTLLPALN